jgi:hypothetical protein
VATHSLTHLLSINCPGYEGGALERVGPFLQVKHKQLQTKQTTTYIWTHKRTPTASTKTATTTKSYSLILIITSKSKVRAFIALHQGTI